MTETHPELSSECRLWRSVLGQSIRDIYEGKAQARNDVFTWMRSNDFVTVCDFAEVQPDNMRQEMLNLAALPVMTAKHYGRRLREQIIGVE